MRKRSAVLVAGAVCLASGLLLSRGAQAASPFDAGVPQLGGTCPSGTTEVQPTAGHKIAGGGFEYDYNVAGTTSKSFVPPSGFRPDTASDQQLSAYGFPPRPSVASQRGEWMSAMRDYKKHAASNLCLSSHPYSTPENRLPSGSGIPPIINGHESSSNWSGYRVQGSGYTDVSAHYNQSYAHACSCTGPTNESTWVGIGLGHPALIQTGTDMYSSNTPFSWYEYLGSSGSVYAQPAGSVGTGSDIYAFVYWRGTYAGFYVSANGTAALQTQVALGSGDYDGNDAEFINERPSTGGSAYPLTNYVNTGWYNATTTSSGVVKTVGAQNPIGIVLVDNYPTWDGSDCSNTHVLAVPYNISGGTFNNQWCRAT